MTNISLRSISSLKAQYEAGANALEQRIDTLAPNARASNQTLGGIGFDADYGILALIHQKFGETDKASAAIKKAVDYRTRQLGQVNAGRDYQTFAQFAALIAIAQGDFQTAANYVRDGQLFSDSYGHYLCQAAGKTLNAEQVLAIANTISARRDLYHCYLDAIPEMAKLGKLDQVEKLVGAYPGDPRQKSDFYSWVIQGLIAKGDVDGAKRYAEKQGLTKDDRGKLKLDAELMD